ncbi:hypothetical protein AB0O05_22720 [Streptomyces sp. NPDC093084]|uniref:hypothetical protein n=1 Tax=Streptomyces sp. NPDC093084 TaxID=3155197 RepID=UPI00342402C7
MPDRHASRWTHWTPDWHDSSPAGTLYARSIYFFCYTYGLTCSDLGRLTQAGSRGTLSISRRV